MQIFYQTSYKNLPNHLACSSPHPWIICALHCCKKNKTKQNKTKQSTKISKSFHWPFFPIQQRKNPSTVLSYPAMQDSLRSHARGKLLLVAGSANARAASSGV
jgi:hypothetical protein